MKTARSVAFSVRLLARLARTPLVGAALVATAAPALVACADENDPATWVKRLDDPLQRSKAEAKLKEMFESKLTTAKTKVLGGNAAAAGSAASTAANAKTEYDDPDVTALLNTIVDPLTKLYAAPPAPLDDTLRKDLMTFLGEMRDVRTGPALAKALNDYEEGKPDDDVRVACATISALQKVGKMTDQPTIDALWNVFAKYRLTKDPLFRTNSTSRITRAIHDSVRDVGGTNAGYGAKAQAMLGNDIKKLDPPDKDQPNALDPDDYADQLQWWQQTAVQIISDQKFAAAIPTLVTVLLTSQKLALNSVVKPALIKMAKDAEPVLIGAINGTDATFKPIIATYKDAEKETYMGILADMLGFLGRTKGRDTLLGMLKAGTATTATGQTAIAQSLVQFPETPDVEVAYRAVYDKLTDNSTIAPSLGGANARQLLLQISSGFYDPAMTQWLVDTALAAKTTPGKLMPLDPAGKIMAADKKKVVSDALDKVTPDIAKDLNATDTGPKGTPKKGDPPYVKAGDKAVQALKEIYGFESKALDDCKTDAMCYVNILDKDIPSTPQTANSYQVKACYMAVVYADKNQDAVRAAMVAKLDKVRNAVARLALVQAIDELAPTGDAAAADALDKITDKDKGLGDNDLIQADNAVAQVSLRLRARAM